jgi:lysozyme family protein
MYVTHATYYVKRVEPMSPKKEEAPIAARPINFSVRLSVADAKRLEIIAVAHDWSLAKTVNKLVVAALDGKLIK